MATRLRQTHVVWRGLLLLLLLSPVALGAADTPAQQLRLADSVKTSNHERFRRILDELAPEAATLPEEARWHLQYLQGWESVYRGDYAKATPQLERIARDCPSAALRFRAEVALMNVDALSLQYDSAFRRLVKLMGQVPQIEDPEARTQFFATAAILYNKVGEYDLATSSAEHLLTEDSSSSARCKGRYFKLLAAFHSGQLNIDDPEIDVAQHACSESGETMLGNSLRILLARLDLSKGNPVAALQVLTSHYDEVEKTGYAELISSFDSELAQAYLQAGDPQQAELYAKRVIKSNGEQEYSESLANAYKVLYLVTKARGDATGALDWYEKYAAADKGYLNEVSAKSLAYQKVKQRVQSSRSQTEAAQKQNRILQLQQTLSEKVAETRGLYAVLLLSALLLLSAWVWRLLRSQRRLRVMAEHDSLTGISNRQHFVNEAGAMLRNCMRAGKDVSLILIDLDHFKEVNDTHGHAAGDAVLKRTVLACQDHMRSSDLFGRLGGEEFGILLPDCKLGAAVGQAERLRHAIAEMSAVSEDTPDVTASIGVASTARASYDLRQLLIHADDALYRAKRSGRNRVSVSDGNISMVRTAFTTVA